MLGTFVQTLDVKGIWTGMDQIGTWVVPDASRRSGPAIENVSVSATTGISAVYTIRASHTAGSSALDLITLLISQTIADPASCQVVYYARANTLNLLNDINTGLVSPTGIQPGHEGAISNSRCSIDAQRSAYAVKGTSMSLTIAFQFSRSTFGGAKNVYVNAFDNNGFLTHWIVGATVSVS
jgi:hypothetical protein